jgi:hypothetical protein
VRGLEEQGTPLTLRAGITAHGTTAGVGLFFTVRAPSPFFLTGWSPRNIVVNVAEALEVKGYNGTVRFDGQTITILRKGAMARLSVGKGEKHIPLAQLTAVQFKPAGRMVNGFIQFTVGGGNEPRSRFGRQTTDAAHDENSVVFHYAPRKAFEGLRDTVQAALAAHHQSGAAVPGAASAQPVPPSIPEQIEQLAVLRDKGALTEDEFEAKKVELLARM